MSYLLNYKNWRAIHESVLFEAANPSLKQTGIIDVPAIPLGNAIKNISEYCSSWGWLDTALNGALLETLTKTIGYSGMPQLQMLAGMNDDASWSKSGDTRAMMDIFKLMIAGIGKYHGIENFGDQLTAEIDPENPGAVNARIADMALQVAADGDLQLYGKNAAPEEKYYKGTISCSHKIDNYGTTIDPDTRNVASIGLRTLCTYLNTFNLTNFANGDCTQYVDLASCLDSNKVLQLGTGAKGVKKSETVVYLYSPTTLATEGATVKQVITVTQGTQGLNGSWSLGFDVGIFNQDTTKLTIDASHPTVQEAGAAIVQALGGSDTITGMNITSGASPKWGGVTYPDSTGVGAPAGVTETDYKTKKEEGNQWLAWRRGKQFADALESFLGPQIIKPGTIVINWKVGSEGEAGGKNITYSVTTKGKAPQVRVDNEFVKAVRTRSNEPLKIYRYKFDWSTGSLEDQKSGWMKKLTGGLLGKDIVDFADLAAGDEIKIKVKLLARDGKPTGDTKDIDVKVSRVEGEGRAAKIYVKKADGTEVEVTKGTSNYQFVKSLTKTDGKGTTGF